MWWCAIIVILIIIIILMFFKLYFIKKSIKEVNILTSEIIKSDTNNVITISSLDKDMISLTKTLNGELQELRNQKLQYKYGNNELKETITNISHDLRTPLTAINGYIDLLKEEESSNVKEEYINIIDNKVNDLIALTSQLFDFSKSLNLTKELKKEKCCINNLLEETIASYYMVFKEKSINPKIDICDEKIYKYIDKAMFIRIIENLISNIIKYSDGDCNIILENSGKIIFSNKATKLDLSTVKKIFNRYYTVENASKNSGIGLSIAKQLVELNNGTIKAIYNDNYLSIEIEFI